MIRSSRSVSPLVVVLLLTFGSSALLAGSWPMYRHDFARSGVTTETLSTPLFVQWTYAAPTPRPAWPEPGRELNKLAFDYAYEVVAADGLAYFGSSADHRVTCLDLRTGAERWSFFTGGPIRFAPALEAGRLFVASDDGCLYCLSAVDGKLLWKFYAGPKPDRIMGNEQLISRWPLRTGVAVENGIVYLTAGMWPAEGVYFYALRAEDGSVVWRREQTASQYRKQPHPGSFSMIGVAPQGYLLADDQRLFVPTGRNAAAAFDRGSGKELYYHSAPYGWGDRWGGTWNFLANGLFFGWRTHTGPDIDVLTSEYQPDPNDGIAAFEADTSKLKRDFPGKLYAVATKDTLYAWGRGTVTAYDFKRWAEGKPARQCVRWEVKHPRVYALILAGKTLFLGGADAVTAIDARQGRLVWRARVAGEARSLAVAEGRLVVGTTTGQVVCFGPEQVPGPPVLEPRRTRDFAGDSPRAALLAQRLLQQTGKREGYCLVLGAGNGGLLYELVQQSKLTVFCAEPAAAKVHVLRQAFDAAGVYGDRLVVQQARWNPLAYPDYFADLIVIGTGGTPPLADLNAAELYRVLRPAGGCLHLFATGVPGGPATLRRWLIAGGVPAEEIETGIRAVRVIRGPLPGAADWTHQYATAGRTGSSTDTRVKLPVRLLWFGKPGPMHMVTRHWGGPAPLCVDGRLFVIGQFRITAVDAYNGRELWHYQQSTPVARWPVRAKGGSVVADKDGVYLATGAQCLRLDPATGKLLQTYPLPSPPANCTVTTNLRWGYLAVDGNHLLGSMGTDQQGWAVFVMDKGGKTWWTYATTGTVNNNCLSLDDHRVYLLDRPDPVAAAAARRRGLTVANNAELVALDLVTGNIVWRTRDGVAGRTELWLSDGVLLATDRSGMTGFDAATGKKLYVRNVHTSRFPVLVRGTIIGEPWAWDLHTGRPKDRLNPFTGKPVSWSFLRSYGCGSIAGGPNLLLFRSGTLGFYDLAGDSGVHNYPGVRAGCYVNAIASNGLVLAPPADAGCTCCYNFQTTLALEPTTRNEQWSIFYDRLPDTEIFTAALNLGAPGDHRDTHGNVWLAAPRPTTRTGRGDLFKPFRFQFAPGGGSYHFDSDYLPLAGTDKPWVYANGLRGLRRAEFDLSIFERGVTSWPVPTPPSIDGHETDACWDNYRSVPVSAEQATVTFRHDQNNLYVAYHRPPPVDGAGNARPWRASTHGNDAPVWKDDSFELYFSAVSRKSRDQLGSKCLHLGVAASGARYDALWTYAPLLGVRDLPRLDVAIDGDTADWAGDGLTVQSLPAAGGKLRPADDFDPTFKVAWNDKGLLLSADIRDDKIVESKAANALWKGDSLELFLTPRLGSGTCFHVIVSPGVTATAAKPRFQYLLNGRPVSPAAPVQAAARRTDSGYVLEVLLPWRDLNLKPHQGMTCGLQLFANDQDDPSAARAPFRVMWHPGEHPVQRRNPFAYQTLRLSDHAGAPLVFTRSARRGPDGLYTAAEPLPFPLTANPAGANPEDTSFAGDWQAAVRTSKAGFDVELALPWALLAKAGISRNDLVVDWSRRGTLPALRVRPTNRAGYERLLVVPDVDAQPRPLTVRLHFAETRGAAAGQRVFDIKLQGKTVLRNLDIAKEAGPNHALVKQFSNVVAARALEVEFIPKTSGHLPIVSALEIMGRPTN